MTSGQGSEAPAVRVLLAIGDAEQERVVAHALEAAGMQITGRSLEASSLLEAELSRVDVVLVARGLHGMSPDALVAIREARVPVVLLVDGPVDAARYGPLAHLVPAGAPPEIAVAAVREAIRRGLLYDALGTADADANGAHAGDAGNAGAPGSVVALTSGKGAPGTTTLAIALAALLSRRGRQVALVDADLRGGNVAPYLDLDPGRGLVGLRRDTAALDRVSEELQQGPGFAVLAGVERAELATGLHGEAVFTVVTALRERFDHVVVDAGSGADRGGEATHLGVLLGARWVLLTSGADLVSVWNARLAVHALERRLPAPVAIRTAVVLNRREGQEHYGAAEVERALGIPVLAAVREDRRAARRAIVAAAPLSTMSAGVARDLSALVSRISNADRAATSAARRWPRLPEVVARRVIGGRR